MGGLTFVTGAFRRHGIAYLDIVAGALDRVVDLRDDSPPKVLLRRRDQYEVASSLRYDGTGDGPGLEKLDRVVMLVPDNPRYLSEARIEELLAADKWKRLVGSPGAKEAKREFDALHEKVSKDKKFPPLDWFEKHWRGRERLLWHVINEAPLEMQVKWYKKYSPLYLANQDRIELVSLAVADIESPTAVTTAMYEWLEREGRGDRLLVNLYGTATTVQFGWYYLAWRRPALKDATFLKCWTDKAARGSKRFSPVSIEVVDKDPIGTLNRPGPREAWESNERRNARGWLEFYLRQADNFSILVMGERGTGKSEAVREAWRAVHGDQSEPVTANCADFNDPVHARSELFGHEKGAFSGAVNQREGLLKKADGRLLFLDEVHHLDEKTRSMLLTALQTDKDGFSWFTPLGGTERIKVKFQPVFASNLSWEELTKLPRDFLDRISQRILVWPPISKAEIPGVWDEVWARMDFKGPNLANPMAREEWFVEWLRERPWPGNFRDLQRIAILVADFQRAEQMGRGREALIPRGTSLQEFLETRLAGQAERPAESPSGKAPGEGVGSPIRGITVPFDLDSPSATEKTWIPACRKRFTEAVIHRFQSPAAAVEELRARGSKMTIPKLSRWRRHGR